MTAEEHSAAPQDTVLRLAASLGVGLLPGPKGTWGSLLTALCLVMWSAAGGGALAGWGYAVFLAALSAVALAVIHLALFRRVFGDDPDPGDIVIDEAAGLALAFWGLAGPGWELFLAFAAFRFFDIAKPLGVNSLQRLPGAWGVLADDLLAGLYACLITRLVAVFM